MSQGSKIVQLNSHRGEQSSANAVKLPAPLLKLRDRCGEHLRKLMVRLFDQVDDTFFDMADQAANNAQQSSYFDAMRELRLKKSRVVALLLQGYNRDFQFIDERKSDSKKPVDMENLSLVQDEALEKQVAIDNMVNRFQGEAGRELEHLSIRFDSLLASASVDDSSNPLGPERVVHNFAAACDDLEMDIKAKLVFFKLFEKHVLANLKQMIEAANKYLIEQGIIPDMAVARPAAARPQPAPTQSPATAGPGYAPQGRGGFVDEESGYLSNQDVFTGNGNDYYDSVDLGNGHVIDPLALMQQQGANLRRGSAPNLPVLQQGTLVSLLSAAQQHSNRLPTMDNGLVNYIGLLEKMVRNNQGDPRARVGESQQDVMNLVNMLFEYILSDRQLQPTVKALIGRLQIPIVKVALLDKTFFNQGGHPARLLLNELATAAIGWTEKAEGENDPFLNKLEEVVLRLLNEFESDIGLFDEILADFQRFQENEKKRRHLVEQRTRDSEVGKAKSEAAKKRVQDELNTRIVGRSVSDLVIEVLKEGWSSYMVLLHLKHGPDHEDWTRALANVDALVQAADPEGNAEALDVDAVSHLIDELRAGLSQTAFRPFDLDKCLKNLEAELVNVAQKRLESQVEFEEDFDFEPGMEDFESAVLGALQETDVDHVAEDVSDLEEEQGLGAVAELAEDALTPASQPEVMAEQDADAQAADPVNQTEAASAEPRSEARIVLVEEQPEPVETQEADQKSLEMVDRIRIGSWVEVTEGEDKKYRCKLAAIIQSTGKYIFVNRMGVKVMEKSRLGLAMALKTETMSLLDDGLLFDRALESVIGNLRSSKQQSN